MHGVGTEGTTASVEADTISANEIKKALLEYIARKKADEQLKEGHLTVTWDGAQLENTRVRDCLDLSFFKFESAIRFTNCSFELPIFFDGAELGYVGMNKSTFPWFSADNAIFRADLDLNDVRALAVNLRGARIGGSLGLSGALLLLTLLRDWNEGIIPLTKYPERHFSIAPVAADTEPRDTARGAQEASIPDAVRLWMSLDEESLSKLLKSMQDFIGDGKKAGGGISQRMLSEKFSHLREGDLSVLKSMLTKWVSHAQDGLKKGTGIFSPTLRDWMHRSNREASYPDAAFYGDALGTGATLFMRNTHIFGTISLVRARIGGRLNYYSDQSREGSFLANLDPQRHALDAEAISIEDDASLSIDAIGRVCLVGAVIKSNLHLEGSRLFLNRDESTAFVCGGAEIGESLFLRHCSVYGGADLVRARIAGALHLGPEFEADNLALDWVKADVFELHPESFPHEVTLDGFVYERLGDSNEGARYLSAFLDCQPARYALRPQPYLQLASVLDATGHDGEARKVRIRLANRKLFRSDLRWAVSPLSWLLEWRKDRARRRREKPYVNEYAKSVGISRRQAHRLAAERSRQLQAYVEPVPFWGFVYWYARVVLWAIAGHGYRPFRALWWLMAVWLVGGLLFGVAHDRGLILPAPDVVIAASPETYNSKIGREPESYESFNKWIYAADVTLPIIDFAQERYWMPVSADERPSQAPPLISPPLPYALSSTVKMAAGLGVPKAISSWPSVVWHWLISSLDSGLARWWYWTAVFLGWLLATIFVGGYTGIIHPPEAR